MFKKLMVAFGVLLMAAGVADAEERWPKWYIGLEGAMPFVSDSGASSNSTSLGDLELDNPGWGVGASLGYMPGGTNTLLDAMRFEVEVFYRENSIDKLGGVNAVDDVSSVAYMVNAFYDFQTGSQFVPYIGAGAGIAQTELNLGNGFVSDKDTGFAYQGMIGVGYQPVSLPNTTFSLGYRYFGVSSPEYGSSTGTNVEHDYDSHSAELGARFAF